MADDDEFDGWAPLRVFALYADAPKLDNPLLLEVLRAEFRQVDVIDGTVVITHPALFGATEDGDPSWGSTSIRTVPVPELEAFDAGADPAGAAAPALGSVHAALEITEELPSYVGVERRRAAFASVLTVLGESTPALALAWEPSQALTGVTPSPHWGFIGLRRRPDCGGELLETLGLSTFDLPDIACRATGPDAEQLARAVYRHAAAVFDGTEFIADGDPVLEPGGLWLRAEWGWGGDPERQLIALIPEPEHPDTTDG